MKLTKKQREVLEAIKNLPDEAIDTSDIPEVLDWSNARRGLLYRPVKQEVALTLDEYVIEWFASKHSDVQVRNETINQVLMEYIRTKEFPRKSDAKVGTGST